MVYPRIIYTDLNGLFPVGSRAGARTVGEGFPGGLCRCPVGCTVPPWPRFPLPPHRTPQADFPHGALLHPSSHKHGQDRLCWVSHTQAQKQIVKSVNHCNWVILPSSKLHFVHFSKFELHLIGSETRVCSYRKADHGLLADRLHPCHGNLFPRLFQSGVATRECPPPRRRPRPGQADGDGDAPDHGPQRRVGLSDVSPRAESGRVVASSPPVGCGSGSSWPYVIPRGVVLCGLEETIERRRGDQLHAKGLYRDPVRSSHSQVVNVSGLRWLACMVLTPLSGANRVWAWPLLTVLGPSARFYEQQGRRHQTLTERAWQMRRLVVRWLPGRELALVADSSFAALELLDNVTTWPRARVITRLRLDAALDDPSPPRAPWTTGRPRRTGKRRPTLAAVLADDKTHGTACLVEQWYGEGPREVEVATDPAVWYPAGKPPVAIRWVLIHDPQKAFAPQVLLSTHPAHTPAQMLPWVVRRWTLEVTC